MAQIHPTAQIDPLAELATDVFVGAYSIIGAGVRVGTGTRIEAHVVIEGNTVIGERNHIYSFNSLGAAPQDKKYAQEPTRLIIGNDNVIREFCTFNRGTVQDGGITRLGNRNWMMAYVHLAHDCVVGNDTIFANNAQIAGHVHVDDFAILGGFTAVHQFCRIGAHSMTAMGTILLQDLPPYVMAAGNPAAPHGINREGLRRRGFSDTAILAIRHAYKDLYKRGLSRAEALANITQAHLQTPELSCLLTFLQTDGRGIIR